MLHTFLTDDWGLHYPIISAPMAGVAGGRLARAVTEAGGLGTIGVGSRTPTDFIRHEADVAREGGTRFGIGLMAWAIEERPELLTTAIEVQPFLVSISFGPVAAYVDRLHAAGIRVATQVQDRAAALEAAAAGVDLVVAQGTEAGGHTGRVSTLPLLQVVLESVDTPVVAAGGIGSARGLAAVLAAGAEGGWIGTAFLVSHEATHTPEAKARIAAAGETQTILTHAFERAQGLAWPEAFAGRALQNAFTERWHDREEELADHPDAVEQLLRAGKERNYDLAFIYAGEVVGLVGQERPAGAVVHELANGAEALLRQRYERLLQGTSAAD